MESLLNAIKIAGTQAKLAELISENAPRLKPVQPQNIWNWLNRDFRVPAEYCPAIEFVTKRQVTCEQLRPDIEWKYLRQQASVDSRH